MTYLGLAFFRRLNALTFRSRAFLGTATSCLRPDSNAESVSGVGVGGLSMLSYLSCAASHVTGTQRYAVHADSAPVNLLMRYAQTSPDEELSPPPPEPATTIRYTPPCASAARKNPATSAAPRRMFIWGPVSHSGGAVSDAVTLPPWTPLCPEQRRRYDRG